MWLVPKLTRAGEPATAAEIIAAEKAERDAKTAGLREARLAKEAADLAKAPGKQAKLSGSGQF